MRLRARVDTNHQEIVRALRQHPGCTVTSLAAMAHGVPDVMIGFRSITVLAEIKGEKGKLNSTQEAWHQSWTGSPVVILRSVDDAVALIDNINAGYKYNLLPGKAPDSTTPVDVLKQVLHVCPNCKHEWE